MKACQHYIYKPQGRDSKPNIAVKSPKLLDEKFEKQCLEKMITLKVFFVSNDR